MQKIISFNENQDIEVKKEVISGILLDITPQTAGGAAICDIADWNKISLDILIEREGKEPVYIVQGYLEDILIGLYSQTTTFDTAKTKLADGYKVMIDLSPAVIVLSGNDKLRVKTRFHNTSFTSLSVADSSVSIETIPAFGVQTRVPQLREYAIPSGDLTVDKNVGNDVVKITMLTDLTTDYLASTKSKPENVDIFADGYEKSVSGNLVEAENIQYLDFNPETSIQDLVLYVGQRINSVRVKSKLDKVAEQGAKLLVISSVEA